MTIKMTKRNINLIGIKGWHKDRICQIDPAQLYFMGSTRQMIAQQSNVLEKRASIIEKQLKRAGQTDQTLLDSKQRVYFDLELSKLDISKSDPWHSHIKRRKNNFDLITVEQNNLRADLAERLIDHPAVIASGLHMDSFLWNFLQSTRAEVTGLACSHGDRQASYNKHPERYRPANNSLAGYLGSSEFSQRANLAGYVLGDDATSADCDLLRRNLYPHQFILVHTNSMADQYLRQSWDGQAQVCEQFVAYLDPDINMLDPVLIPEERLSEIDWPRISVITVSYNQGLFLRSCLDSVLGQNYPNLEYIVVDAVSTDESIEILQEYKSQLSQLIIEKDQGQSEGLNKGLDLATGDILTWINSDDMLAPGALRRSAMAMLDYEVDLIVGGCERITNHDDEITISHHSALPFCEKLTLGFCEQLNWTSSWEKGDYFFQPEVLFTRDIWLRSGGYLKQHLYWAMDWDLWVRMAMAGATVAHIPGMIGRSREHEAQKTTQEERYLYQLKNILLEYSDLLSQIKEQFLTTLSDKQPPEWLVQESGHSLSLNKLSSDILRKFKESPNKSYAAIIGLIKSARKRLVTKKRLQNLLPTSVYLKLKRYKVQMPWIISGIPIIGFLIAKVGQRQKMIADLMRKAEEYDHLNSNFSILEQARDAYKAEHAAIASQLEEKVSELASTEEARDAYKAEHAVIASQFEQRSVELEDKAELIGKLIAEFIMESLFAKAPDAEDLRIIGILLSSGSSVREVMRTIAIRHYNEQSKPSYQLVFPILMEPIDIPKPIKKVMKGTKFVVVDIGAEPLEFEKDVYQPLISSWSSTIVCFDPMDKSAPRTAKPNRRNKASRRILPNFVGTGEPAKFHLAKMQSTSSLLEPNHNLAKNFALLSEALEIVEESEVETITLDQALQSEKLVNNGVDFLKIDVQGSSFDVIKGAKETLLRTLVCQVEAEFSEVYKNETLFSDIDKEMRALGFGLVDFPVLGRQRYNALDVTEKRYFHASRLLWGDCLYVRHLDTMHKNLSEEECMRVAIIMHEVYQKYDLAAFATSCIIPDAYA